MSNINSRFRDHSPYVNTNGLVIYLPIGGNEEYPNLTKKTEEILEVAPSFNITSV